MSLHTTLSYSVEAHLTLILPSSITTFVEVVVVQLQELRKWFG